MYWSTLTSSSNNCTVQIIPEDAMLTAEDNAALTQVGPGTPLGKFFRRYWIPAAKSEEIREPGGAPVRVGLLGEKLVAFRDPTGKPGLMDEFCPHRRASLYYGRNEEGG